MIYKESCFGLSSSDCESTEINGLVSFDYGLDLILPDGLRWDDSNNDGYDNMSITIDAERLTLTPDSEWGVNGYFSPNYEFIIPEFDIENSSGKQMDDVYIEIKVK